MDDVGEKRDVRPGRQGVAEKVPRLGADPSLEPFRPDVLLSKRTDGLAFHDRRAQVAVAARNFDGKYPGTPSQVRQVTKPRKIEPPRQRS